ncbi:MAG: hypothetical protein JST82_13355 [Bacteroidetes bacterium]|nr:hypothetical protein [Bacteroidota bacterium]
MKLTAIATTVLFAAVLAFAACKREKTTTDDLTITEDTYYADDQAKVDQTYNEVENFTDQAAVNGTVEMKGGEDPSILSACATVTKDTTSTPHKITIDFGATNCLCKDGRYRRGKIILTYNGKYRDSGYVHTISFDGYYVNNNRVIGGKSVTNMGHNSSGQTYYNVSVDGGLVLTTGDTIKHVSTRTRTWVSGESTTMLSDDAYEITGSGTNTRATGKSVSFNITSPLLIALNCNWIKSGTIEFTPAGASSAKRTIDYGTGICDDQATVTVGTKTKTITLK